MQISTFKEHVDLIILPDGVRLYLIGTAHISRQSAELAEEVIREVRPDVVAVELCAARYESMRNPDRWKQTDIISVIRDGKSYVLLTQLLLAAFQKKMGEHLKVKPGLEMLRAAEVGEEVGARIALVDRDIKVTLRRAWRLVGWWSLTKIFFSSLAASIDSKKVEEHEIELLKTGDALDALMKEFSDSLPEIRRVLIDERDEYMAEKLRRVTGTNIVAVVGAGHCQGMKRALPDRRDLSALETIPPPSRVTRSLGWTIPGLLVGFLVYGFFSAGADTSFDMAKAWVFTTSTSAAIGAILSLGHPLTILTALAVAPLTTLHPFLAAGWFAGIVEAWVRRPQVKDFESIADDMGSVKGIWRNRLARVFLIMLLVNASTSLGMIWGAKIIATLAYVS